jgi:hypothetical protein
LPVAYIKQMLTKIKLDLAIDPKRDKQLITPCCNKKNHNGKFVNFKNLAKVYGYCHSCGVTTLPPAHYVNEVGDEFLWNNLTVQFDPVSNKMCHNVVSQIQKVDVTHATNQSNNSIAVTKYIDFELVKMFEEKRRENALLLYMRGIYGDTKTNIVKEMYHIGTSKKGGAVFWKINKHYKVQKAKVCFYNKNGKRTKYFKSPFLNKDGYVDCLYGEHLIDITENLNKTLVLVESEKTAGICSIMLPEYVWLAYGGINGLTTDKATALIGRDVIIVPDMSENALRIMNNKLPYLSSIDVKAKIWDMTKGKSDEQLRQEGLYNCDLEDVFNVFLLAKYILFLAWFWR